ncbi:uncharacterized protein PHACADRAFT_55864, partial [Phanerochaete carnosa HHB-10118-sp]
HPLAYVEWFTPLQVRDLKLGMYSVARSTVSQKRRTSVISVDQIIRTCHLLPIFGKRVDLTWSPVNILE